MNEPLAQIEKDAKQYCEGWGEENEKKEIAFKSGAISQNNKVIEKCIQMIVGSKAPEYGPMTISVRELRAILESLKIIE